MSERDILHVIAEDLRDGDGNGITDYIDTRTITSQRRLTDQQREDLREIVRWASVVEHDEVKKLLGE